MSSREHEGSGIRGVMPPIRASTLLRVRTLWLAPIASTAILMFFMTLFYIGAIVNPTGHLSGLPVALVNEDNGGTVQGSQVNFGAEVASDLLHTSAVTSRLSLDEVSYAQAKAQMNSNKASSSCNGPPTPIPREPRPRQAAIPAPTRQPRPHPPNPPRPVANSQRLSLLVTAPGTRCVTTACCQRPQPALTVFERHVGS